jgi:hypothetical protein
MEKIVGAAIRDESGTVHAVAPPGRHHDVIRFMVSTGYGERVHTGEQGFITSGGEFLAREPALVLALASGQVREDTRPVPGLDELFSEDLW